MIDSGKRGLVPKYRLGRYVPHNSEELEEASVVLTNSNNKMVSCEILHLVIFFSVFCSLKIERE
jgi:hypothetical protein